MLIKWEECKKASNSGHLHLAKRKIQFLGKLTPSAKTTMEVDTLQLEVNLTLAVGGLRLWDWYWNGTVESLGVVVTVGGWSQTTDDFICIKRFPFFSHPYTNSKGKRTITVSSLPAEIKLCTANLTHCITAETLLSHPRASNGQTLTTV